MKKTLFAALFAVALMPAFAMANDAAPSDVPADAATHASETSPMMEKDAKKAHPDMHHKAKETEDGLMLKKGEVHEGDKEHHEEKTH